MLNNPDNLFPSHQFIRFPAVPMLPVQAGRIQEQGDRNLLFHQPRKNVGQGCPSVIGRQGSIIPKAPLVLGQMTLHFRQRNEGVLLLQGQDALFENLGPGPVARPHGFRVKHVADLVEYENRDRMHKNPVQAAFDTLIERTLHECFFRSNLHIQPAFANHSRFPRDIPYRIRCLRFI